MNETEEVREAIASELNELVYVAQNNPNFGDAEIEAYAAGILKCHPLIAVLSREQPDQEVYKLDGEHPRHINTVGLKEYCSWQKTVKKGV